MRRGRVDSPGQGRAVEDDQALNVYPEHVAGHRPGSADKVAEGLTATAGKPRYWISHGKRGFHNLS